MTVLTERLERRAGTCIAPVFKRPFGHCFGRRRVDFRVGNSGKRPVRETRKFTRKSPVTVRPATLITAFGSKKTAVEPAQRDDIGNDGCRALRPTEVDYVNLHGTSTQLNDRIETKASKTPLANTLINSRRARRNRKSDIRRARRAQPESARRFWL